MSRSESLRIPTLCVFYMSVLVEVSLVTGLVSGPTFQRIFDLTDMRLGFALSAAYVGLLIIAPVAGHVTQTRGPIISLILGLLLNIVSMSVINIAPGFPLLFVGLLGIGSAAGLIANANITVLGILFPFRNRQILSLASALWFGSSAVSAPLIGSWLGYAARRGFGAWSFRTVYFSEMFLLFVALIMALYILRRALPNSDSSDRGTDGGGGGFSLRQLWVPIFGFCEGLMVIVMLAWMSPMVQEKFGAGDFHGGLAVGVMALGLGCGRLLFSFMQPGSDERKLIAVTAVCGSVLFLAALLNPSYWGTVSFLAAGAFVSAPVGPCLLALPHRIFPGQQARVLGYFQACIALAGLTGPSFVGVLAEQGVPIWIGIGICPLAGLVLAALNVLWVRREPLV